MTKKEEAIPPTPNLAELWRINETVLQSRLEAVRAVLSHAGEKGRALERDVEAILRQILPSEYGLSTGFIAYHDDHGQSRLTEQLDLVIYDSARSGPLARFGTCDVFPLEAVFGYVEVKASLRSSSDDTQEVARNSIEYCLQQNERLRSLRTRYFWVPQSGTQTRVVLKPREWNAIRGYLVAFEASGEVASNPSLLAQRMADYSARVSPTAHLHGLLVVGKGFFQTRPVDKPMVGTAEQHKIDYVTAHSLLAFATSLLAALARFPRAPVNWVPAVDRYYERPEWRTCSPGTQAGDV